MRTERIIIYPKDIQRITGKSERYGRLLIHRIREHLKKQGHHFITVEEFCDFTGLKVEQVVSYLSLEK